MRNLTDFAIRQEYERIRELGDKLVEIGNRIKWEGFRSHPLSYKDEMHNKRISRKRSPVERFFAFTKMVFKAGHVAVTTAAGVRVKMIVTGIVFNVYHLASAKIKLEA